MSSICLFDMHLSKTHVWGCVIGIILHRFQVRTLPLYFCEQTDCIFNCLVLCRFGKICIASRRRWAMPRDIHWGMTVTRNLGRLKWWGGGGDAMVSECNSHDCAVDIKNIIYNAWIRYSNSILVHVIMVHPHVVLITSHQSLRTCCWDKKYRQETRWLGPWPFQTMPTRPRGAGPGWRVYHTNTSGRSHPSNKDMLLDVIGWFACLVKKEASPYSQRVGGISLLLVFGYIRMYDSCHGPEKKGNPGARNVG
jgi:hypothetical protein